MSLVAQCPRRTRIGSSPILVAALFLFVGSVEAGEPLLQNAAWEPGEDKTLPAGWRIGAQGQDVRLDQRDVPPGSARSLRIDIREVRQNWGEVTQSVRGLKPGASYRLSGTVKSSADRLGLLQVKLYKDDRELRRISSVRSSTKWSRIEQEFSIDQADKVEILCRWTQDKPESVGQTVWFAGLELVELGPPRLVAAESVGTFHSLGLTATYEGGANHNHLCRVRYRSEGETAWRSGMDLVLYPPDNQYRGSLSLLEPGHRYEVECELLASGQSEPLSTVVTWGRTWSERIPIAEVRRLPKESDQPLVIRTQGRPDGWILYAPAEDASSTIDVGQTADHAVVVEDAAYVVFENVILRGGRKDCVRLAKSHRVCIRRCDIAGWGDPGERREGLEYGLYVDARGWRPRIVGLHSGRGRGQFHPSPSRYSQLVAIRPPCRPAGRDPGEDGRQQRGSQQRHDRCRGALVERRYREYPQQRPGGRSLS